MKVAFNVRPALNGASIVDCATGAVYDQFVEINTSSSAPHGAVFH